MTGTHDKNLPDIQHAKLIRDSDELRNINCYEYLKAVLTHLPAKLPEAYQHLRLFQEVFQTHPDYVSKNAYSDMYTSFLLTLEEGVSQAAKTKQMLQNEIHALEAAISTKKSADALQRDLKNKQKQLASLYVMDPLIDLVYANPNHALERSANMIDGKQNTHTAKTSAQVQRKLMGTGSFIDHVNKTTSHRKTHPASSAKVDPHMKQLLAQFSRNYKPQTMTSLASIRSYDYKDATMPAEYRFGTQGQFHNGIVRINPIFEEWLAIQARKPSGKKVDHKIDHIYVNNLGLDRWDLEGLREQQLSAQLHEMENRHKNIAVITLPSDKGLLSQASLIKHHKTTTGKQAAEKILDVATGDSSEKIKDFHISNAIKKLLYGEIKSGSGSKYDKQKEKIVLKKLLQNSFDKLGFEPKQPLSDAQFQALYFHFIKYEMTNYIITTLNPVSFNMSCKDALDRGGASSAYYNLMKSMTSGKPMSHDEFNRALYTGSTPVKERGMNHPTKLIWNAIDAYLAAPINANNGNIPEWLQTWHTENAPEGTRQYYINQLNSYTSLTPRSRQASSKLNLFNQPKDPALADSKAQAVKKILALLTEPESRQIFSSDEQKALCDRELKKLLGLMKTQGLIDLDQQAGLHPGDRNKVRT